MGRGVGGLQAGGMTHRARPVDHEAAPPSSAETPGRDAVPDRGEFLEFLGLTLAAGVVALFLVRPDAAEALVHALTTSTAALVH